MQVLFNYYCIFDWAICNFHITSYLTQHYVCFSELLSVRTLCGAYHKELASH